MLVQHPVIWQCPWELGTALFLTLMGCRKKHFRALFHASRLLVSVVRHVHTFDNSTLMTFWKLQSLFHRLSISLISSYCCNFGSYMRSHEVADYFAAIFTHFHRFSLKCLGLQVSGNGVIFPIFTIFQVVP